MMETITIPKREYEALKKCQAIVRAVESTIHQGDDWRDLQILSEKTAQELWDNEYDDVWNAV